MLFVIENFDSFSATNDLHDLADFYNLSFSCISFFMLYCLGMSKYMYHETFS